MALVSQRAYAKRRGISRAAVWKRMTAAGGPIPTHGPKKLIDVAEADALWEGTKTPQGEAGAAAAREPEPGALDGTLYRKARTARMVTLAKREQLELRARKGTLISRDFAVMKAFSFARMLRDPWLTWPARVGPQLAAERGVEAAGLVVALEDQVVVPVAVACAAVGIDPARSRRSCGGTRVCDRSGIALAEIRAAARHTVARPAVGLAVVV